MTEQYNRHVRDWLQIARQNVDHFYAVSAAREEERRAQNAANTSEAQARQQARQDMRREKRRRQNVTYQQQAGSIYVDENCSWFRGDTEFPSDEEAEY
jgi:hypothetical protein